MKKSILLLIVIPLSFCRLVSAGAIGLTDDSSSIGGGARALGMGKAFVAVADDSDTSLINPAGLGSMKGWQVMGMFTNIMQEVYYREITTAFPSDLGVWGLSFVGTGVDQVPVPIGPTTVYADYYDNMLLLSYGSPLARFFDYGKNIYVGGNLKLFSRGWSGGINQSAVGLSADLGAKLVLSPNLSFGICRQNLLPVAMGGVLHWGSGSAEAFAGMTRLGMALKPRPWGENILLAVDLSIPSLSGRPLTGHLGVEWQALPALTLRAGLDQNIDAASASKTSWNPTFGSSLNYAGFRFDYAFHAFYDDPSLSNNYVSLSYQSDPTAALKGEVF